MVWSPTEDVRREVAKEDLGMDPTRKKEKRTTMKDGLITSRRPWQPGMSKISRTVRGGEEVARNVGPSMKKKT
jgi:hypothetical protein